MSVPSPVLTPLTTWTQAGLVSLGGVAGCLARWRFGVWLNTLPWPIAAGTLAVNVIGGLVVGFMMVVLTRYPSDAWRLLVVTGFLGGMTTFSAFTAESLGLTQAAGAFLSSPGQIVTSASDWMDNFTQNFSDQFSSFQIQNPGGLVPGEKRALEAWAQSTGGQYEFLKWTANTPPIVNSIVPNAERLFGGSAVPEPSTWALILLGFAGLGLAGYRASRKRAALAAQCA